MKKIALIGNPNTGKSSLFNLLTGIRQHIANYPGVTVINKHGIFRSGEVMAEIVDLPGTYSLASVSPDERIVEDILLGKMENEERPDLVVAVADASQLKRNLFLVTQIAELNLPMLLVVNMIDSARADGFETDTAALSVQMGIPIVETCAKTGEGIPELKTAIEKALSGPCYMKKVEYPERVSEASQKVGVLLSESGVKKHSSEECYRLLFDANSSILHRYGLDNDKIKSALSTIREELFTAGYNPFSVEAVLQYKRIVQWIENSRVKVPERVARITARLDSVLMNRVLGPIIFFGVMFLVFMCVYQYAGYFIEMIEGWVGSLQEVASGWFAEGSIAQSAVVDGIIGGVGSFIVFLPQILILFLFIAMLEESGYMARAAVMMDKLLGWCGLNGRSFVPMLSCYACGIPGVMAARNISEPKARLLTILVAPLLSCSARLPVYLLMIGAFVEPRYGVFVASLSLFAMHLLGLIVAMPVSWAFNRFFIKTPQQPFVLELPRYHVPTIRNVSFRVWSAGVEFIQRAGSIIFVASLIIWALTYFPRLTDEEINQIKTEVVAERVVVADSDTQTLTSDSETSTEESEDRALEAHIASHQMENSYLGRMGKFIQPVFDPAGFDWKISIGVVASFPAREVIIATLGTIYSINADELEESDQSLRSAMMADRWTEGKRAGQPVFNLPVAFAIMVFFALCAQCMALLATIIQEIGWRWGLFSFVYMTFLAWIGAVLTYQIGMLF